MHFQNNSLQCVNDKAKLIYQVGLANFQEINPLGNSTVIRTGQNYWLGSPNFLTYNCAFVSSVSGGYSSSGHVFQSYGVRPAISLKPGIEYSSGDGSKTNPYVVKMN